MPMRLGTPMPGLDGAIGWLNSEGEPKAEPARATLIHFWAVSCHICHETMNDLMCIRNKYEKDGLRTIAIHMPRYESDASEEKVQEDINTYHITQPVGLDHMLKVAESFQNEYVPAFFLFDQEGNLKYRASGAAAIQTQAAPVQNQAASGSHL